MESTVSLQSPDYLLISQAAAAAFAAVRLLHFGLRRHFPLLLSFLVFSCVSYLVFSVTPPHSPTYYWAYMVCQPLTWIAETLAISEMFTLFFQHYPGLRTGGRWALYIALALAVVISLVMAVMVNHRRTRRSLWLYYELILDRSIVFGLAAVIIVLVIFVSRYPLHLERNTRVACGFFGAILLADAAVKLLDSAAAHLKVPYADLADVAFSSICLLGWGAMLRPVPTIEPARSEAKDVREAEILQKLDSLNEILSRSGRR
jgi:hypothetical protein